MEGMQLRNCEFTHTFQTSRESTRVMQSSLKIAPPPLRSRACTHTAHTSISHVYWACALDPLDAHSFVVLGLRLAGLSRGHGPHAVHIWVHPFRGCAKCDRVHTKGGQDLASHPDRTEHPRPACVVHTAQSADRVALFHMAAHETKPLTHTSNGLTLWWAWAKPFAPHA